MYYNRYDDTYSAYEPLINDTAYTF
jgi:hypothetical protein